MAENSINTEQGQVEICYFGSNSFSLELKDELIQVLSPSLSIKLVPLSGGGAPWLPPMLELILVFASTTVVTSILSKIGEDIYTFAKDKVFRKGGEKKAEISFRIKILTEDIAISGHLQHLEDYETFIQAINNTLQMINEAKNADLQFIDQNNPIPLGNANQFASITKSGILFEYEYSKENSKWELKNIAKIRKFDPPLSTHK